MKNAPERITGLRCMLLALAGLIVSPLAMAQPPERPVAEASQLIVKFKEDRPGNSRASEVISNVAQQHGVALERGRTLATGGDIVTFRNMPDRGQLERVVAAFERNPHVEYAEIDEVMSFAGTPNDPRYGEQWHYYEATGGARLPDAWDDVQGNGVRVAVLDTGYRPHSDLDGNIVGGYDFITNTFKANDGNGRDSNARDPGDWLEVGECYNDTFYPSSWHGTHVAGTVAAETNNSKGVSGVAYKAKVVPVRVLGKCGGDTSDIAEAVIWAAGGSVNGVPSNNYPAKVINLSLGMPGDCSSTMQSAINSARNNGATVVVAAGNYDVDVSGFTPANCNGVVSVAATDRSAQKAYYSNYGNKVDLAAPGGETNGSSANGVLSTLNAGSRSPGSDSYAFYSGTSMAAPHVAGVAALMLDINNDLSPSQVESILKSSARNIPDYNCSGCGAGLLDAKAAVRQAADPYLYTEYAGCSGYGSQYALMWSLDNTSGVIKWDVDKRAYGSSTWNSFYDGGSGSTFTTIYGKTRFRVRAKLNSGWTSFTSSSWLNNFCSGGGGFDPR